MAFKQWLVDVLVKQAGPSAIRGAILGTLGWLMLKNGMLEPYGIVSDEAARTTILYWDKLSVAAIALLPAIGAWLIKATQVAVVKPVVQKVVKPKEE